MLRFHGKNGAVPTFVLGIFARRRRSCMLVPWTPTKPSPKPPPSRSQAAKLFEHAIDEFLDEARIDAAPVSTPDGLQDASLGGGRRALSGKAFPVRSRDEYYRAEDSKLTRVSFPPASDFAQSAHREMLDVDGAPVCSTSVNVVVAEFDLVEDGRRRRAPRALRRAMATLGAPRHISLARTCGSAYGAAQPSFDAPRDHEYPEVWCRALSGIRIPPSPPQ